MNAARGGTGAAPRTGGRNWGGAAALTVLILAGALVAQTDVGRAATRALGLAAPPARYTELALVRPDALPAQVGRHGEISFAFTIHDAEGTAWSYRWAVSVAVAAVRGPAVRGPATIGTAATGSAGNGATATGTVRLAAGEQVTIARQLSVTCSASQARVQVTIARPAQSVGFWVTCSPGARGSR